MPHKNPEARRQFVARWLEKNRETVKAKQHLRYLKNRDKRRLQAKEWFEANRERATATRRAWYSANKDTVHRDRQYRRLFDFTLDDYNRLLRQQGGRCWICRRAEPGHGRKYFSVDHCHRTKRVRGLLCGLCNLGVGHFRDDPRLLKRAIQYLQR